jgi:DNA-binding NtrC family response regulator
MAGSHRLMVVDDEKDILTIVMRWLKRWGFAADGFSDPVAALGHFQHNSTLYSIVISDVRMAGMSGIELASHVLRINPDIKIILMTAYELDQQDLATTLPVIKLEDILKKPFKLIEVCKAVKKQLAVDC